MKKSIILIAAAAFMAVSANAQIVTSRTMVKNHNTMWYVRAGMSINNLAGVPDETGLSLGSKVGMDVDFGFHRNIGKSGAYWGMELGVGTRGASFDVEDYGDKFSTDLSAWNIKYSPFTFGYKYSVTDDLKIDGHLGAFLSYDFSKKFEDADGDDMLDYIDYQDLDAGIQVGIGAWYKKFNIDLTYQRGFVNAAEIYDGDKDKGITSSNFEIRVGYAF